MANPIPAASQNATLVVTHEAHRNHSSASEWDAGFQRDLAINSWTMFAIGMLLIWLRVYARVSRVGLRSLKGDDYLMLLAAAWFIVLVVTLNLIAAGGGSNLFPAEELPFFTESEIRDRIHSSKIVVLSEQAMLNLIYTLKACMLFMYSRLIGTEQRKQLLYVSIFVFLGWIASQIAFFSICRPFKGYWMVPPPNPHCATLQNFSIVQACFNISSDLLMLFIPAQMVVKLHMPWKKKIVLGFIFSLGIFVITAAILTKVFNFSNIWSPAYMLWYSREASVAVYVANLPVIWPLLREWMPILRSHRSQSASLPYHQQTSKSQPGGINCFRPGSKSHPPGPDSPGFVEGSMESRKSGSDMVGSATRTDTITFEEALRESRVVYEHPREIPETRPGVIQKEVKVEVTSEMIEKTAHNFSRPLSQA